MLMTSNIKCVLLHNMEHNTVKNKWYIKTNKAAFRFWGRWMWRDGNGTLHMYIWVSHAIQRPASNNLPVLAVALEALTKNKGIN